MNKKNLEDQPDNKLIGGRYSFLAQPIPVHLVLFGLSWLIMSAIIQYSHFWLGLPITLVLGLAVAALVSNVYRSSWIEQWENPLPGKALIDNLVGCISATLLLTITLAWISYVLSQYGLSQAAEGSMAPTYNNLVVTYLWHLVDLIPLINPEKTFGMKDPRVRFIGWVPGLPIFFFRLFVIVVILAAVRLVWVTFHNASQKALLERLDRVATQKPAPKS